jgi:GNAT superfamily N-acetyltransferase
MKELVLIRPSTEGDLHFVLNSWLMSYRRSPFARDMTKNIYFKRHHDFVVEALKRSAVYCAVNKDDQDQIYGWICIEPPVGMEETRALHYVYVKHPYRGFGIAKSLTNHALENEEKFVYSHVPSGMLYRFLNLKGFYDPYRFFHKEAA